MTRIDAHQHFWDIARGDYHWLTPELGPIYRNFLPSDLAPNLEAHGISGTILVQAAPTLAETRFMLSLADNSPAVKGVVGWVDFESTDAPQIISDLAAHPALVGLRPMIQDIEDDDWMLRDNLTPAFEALIANDLTFDALTFPRHLENLSALLIRYPDMRVVIDHGSKPLIRDSLIDDWAASMKQLAADTNAFCKLSGLVTEAKPDWSVDDLRPYVDHLLSTFGPQRILWGSDWPVCLLASSYERWVEATETLLNGLTPDEKEAVLGLNALRAYGLN
ncbi:amidohydrolase family protein [Roseibium album]|uniref:Putative metal-dependent hydrolase of the TIM-barrel fold protein n=1 Tax=Roseibium album TaxID=311410 RepID=A0A0M7A8X2_9HYPH|nr:amidohydrolase family protein [Roseibium album]CTQ57764.1 putative metal-dependent hydrolase of the TIM-barrel fold protein [Roseibium album]CTQ68381.1 putative metal-dependent hydrolase of the TIM-barrel fold protein [Roseibium album]CTQ70680.1 putative metal-dependent hydrolase of the TIM-barrel fold protein [Roseibium album]